MFLSKKDYQRAIKLGIEANPSLGDSGALSAFAEACYNDNTADDILCELEKKTLIKPMSWNEFFLTKKQIAAAFEECISEAMRMFEEKYNFFDK